MKKGEIWMADLNPTQGSEQEGKRPVVIVSGNLLNTYSPVVWICPITTKIKNYKGDLVLNPTKTNGLSKTSELIIIHLRSISKNRLVNKLSCINMTELESLRVGLIQTLTLD